MATEVHDKHVYLANKVLPSKKAFKPKKNVNPVVYDVEPRKTKLTMCIMPSWGVFFPPYNLARLTALTRSAGYETAVFDFNVEGYHDMGVPDAWDSNHWFWWHPGEWETRVLPGYKKVLDGWIKKILDTNPDVLGFSVYDTNYMCTHMITKEIKKMKPNLTIIYGGPQCHTPEYIPPDFVDHYVRGEGEQVLIDFLDKKEKNLIGIPRQLGETFNMSRVDIDSLTFPDYTDYDLSKYTSTFGISAELSRGCVAKCSFCKETWFWKYRDRHSERILDELQEQTEKYGMNFVWFIDSLTNGNLKTLREFVEGVVERKMDIKWMGYARCDKRMDDDYFRALKAGGCVNLSFGIESGSQKVLDMMRKNIDLEDINSNLLHCEKYGIDAHANWIVGAQGEDIQALAHGMNLVWNNRNRIFAISPGMGMSDAKQTDFEFNRERYNMSPWDRLFEGAWWSLDWENTKLHRAIRIKYFYIWLEECKKKGTIQNAQDRPRIVDHFTLDFDDEDSIISEVPYEEFDHNIVKLNMGTFADTVVNELFGLCRMLWRVRGGFELSTHFDHDQDMDEFGRSITTSSYNSKQWFKIDKEGNFECKATHNFEHKGEWWMVGHKSFDCDFHVKGKWDENTFEITYFEGTGNSQGENAILPMDLSYEKRNLVKGKTTEVDVYEIF